MKSEPPAHSSGRVIRCISPKELLGLTPTFKLNDERIWGLLNRLNLFRAFLFPCEREVNFNDIR